MELRGTVGEVIVSPMVLPITDGDSHHPRGTAPGKSLRGASRCAGAPLQHDEARRHECTLPGSLAQADRTFVYAANLGWMRAPCSRPSATRFTARMSWPTLIHAVVAEAKSGDQVVVMSNGGFGGIHAVLPLERLAK